MNNQLFTLSAIFSDRIFRIPDYQRGYSWTEKEITEFFKDLQRLPDNRKHYVGVLTLEPIDATIFNVWLYDKWLIEGRSFSPFYVVDGQQRLTTSIILIQCLIEQMQKKSIDRLNYSTCEAIVDKFIYSSKDNGQTKTFLFCYELDNPSYDHLITNIYKEYSQSPTNFQETVYTRNLTTAKEYFMTKLNPMDIVELDSIYKKITQSFLFNFYEIGTEIDVFVTFETMNNRGKPLSHLELLKNRLIYLASLLPDSPEINKTIRQDINTCWKDIYHYLGRNKQKLLPDDEFLSAHFLQYYSEARKPTRRFSPSIGYQYNYLQNIEFIPENIDNKKLTSQKISLYIKSLKQSVKYWAYINDPQNSNYSDSIKEYFEKISFLLKEIYYNDFYWDFEVTSYPGLTIKTILLVCTQQKISEKELLIFLKTLERYLFLLCLYIPEKTDPFLEIDEIDFLEEIDKICNGNYSVATFTERIEKKINLLFANQSNLSRLITYFNKHGFYRNQFSLHYFLYEYERYLYKQSKTNQFKLDTESYFSYHSDSIEHIYPIHTHLRYWNQQFEGFSTKQRNQFKKSLGNLVAISSSKNSSLGNKSFPEKKGNHHNTVGYKYGTYAEIELTNYSDWGPTEILERGLKLVEFLEQHWNIKIGGSKNDKKKFLGLEFYNFK